MNNKITLPLVVLLLATSYFFIKSLGSDSADTEYQVLKVGDFNAGAHGAESPDALTRQEVATRAMELAYGLDVVAVGKFVDGNMPSLTPDVDGNPAAPQFLSQTGVFADVENLVPNPAMIPYELIEPFWSDGAEKFRWLIVPNDGTHDTADEQITFTNDLPWDFPRGSVLIKHFELGGKRLETRFEVKGDDDVYYYLTYKWNDDQDDAELLSGSLDEDIDVGGQVQTWHYPSRAECVSCHFPQIGGVLGPKTRNLNMTVTYPSGLTANQLVNLSEMGLIPEVITEATAPNYMKVYAKDDTSASLEDRARTYLDMNCASCHNPTVVNIAQFDATFTRPLEETNLIYGEVAYDEGLVNPRVIVPQETDRSMAHFRMNSLEVGIMMPPLAKDVVDAPGVQLIADWINSLTPTADNPPTAAFAANPVFGDAPLNVDFDASASDDLDGDVLTYDWDFGDGNNGTGETTSHTYTSAGDYTVTLTVSDGSNTDTASTDITVNSVTDDGAVAFSDETSLISGSNTSGLVMGVVDLNGDGRDDLMQYDDGRNLKINYQNAPGASFTQFTYGNVSGSDIQWATAVADVDGNGFNDILNGGSYDNVRVFSNNGSNTFTPATLPTSDIFIQGSGFADINNDGAIDIFATHDDGENMAYENNGSGTFSANQGMIRTFAVPGGPGGDAQDEDNAGNYASTWIDFDNDGDLDMYLSKCRGGVTDPSDPRRINMLFVNDGDNNYSNGAAAANLDIGAQTWLTDFGDIDNDGDLDCIVINHDNGPNLMRNNGNGTFTEVTSSSGLLPTLSISNLSLGVQGFLRDFNNDGYLDLMVSGDAHYLFYNDGDGTFTPAQNPFNSNDIHSFVVGDLNHDGFLDVYAGYATNLNTPTSTTDRLWINQGNSNNFLAVQLTGNQGSNPNGIGARVEIYGPWGQQIRDVKSGEGYGVMNSLTQHFGLGASTQIDRVVVKWPSGVISQVDNPAANQFLQISECPDSDGDGVCDDDDICPGGDDNIDIDNDGTPDFCDDDVNCEQNEMTLSLTFDEYAVETSWEILDENGATVASGSGYTAADNETTINEPICLPTGCYDLVISDTAGDGLCCDYGDGSYTLSDTASGFIIASGGEFTDSETTNFCVPTCTDTDGDGVCDADDICEGGDDNVDTDGDGIPDFCDDDLNCDEAVTIKISFDDFAAESSWQLLDSEGMVVISGDGYTSANNNQEITETVCLANGCYDFVMLDSEDDGMCCGDNGNGSYTVTDGNGNVLASGGQFQASETTNFCVPACTDTDGDGVCDADDICPAGDDNIDTDGDGTPDACDTDCTNVTLTINFDDYAKETSWQLLDDGGAVIHSGGGYTDADDFTTLTEDFCLADGCYDFVINDHPAGNDPGDGICCGFGNGSYSLVDSNNNVLVSGGEFADSETTNFCVLSCSGQGVDTEYVLNGGSVVTGTTDLEIFEGDELILGMAPDAVEFSVTGPNGNDKPMSTDDLTIAAASTADAGTYSLETASGCIELFELTVLTCDDLGLQSEYAINGETPVTGATAAQADEGDQIVLSINLDGKAFSVSGPNGNDKPLSTDDLTIAAATAADAGTYTFTTEEGCSVGLDLSVFTCDSLGLETEYAINGETPVTGATAAQSDEGDQIVLSINLDGKAFSVSGPNGNDKPMSTDDLTIAAATAADAGTYTFTTEEGCSVELDLSVFTCDSLGLETEYAINGETPVTGATAAQADEGDQIVLSINLDGKAFSVSGPNGNDKPMSTDDLTIAAATAADAGTYTFTTEEGCSVELDLSVFTCDSLGLETEYAINGETPVTGATAAQADEGDQIVLSINLDGKAFSVSGPNGNDKPMSTDDLTIAAATAADAGTYTFTTEEGCSVELDLSVFTCDSLGLETEYAINGETPVTGATAAQADEGDQIVLSINLDGKAFSVSGPNGNDKPMSTDDLTIATATAADAGTYTFTTEEGCSVELDLSVFTCDSLGLETEYAINGETPVTGATAAQADEGDQIVLSINLDGKAFSVSGPNGNDKPMSTDDLTIATATAADAGTYTFTTEEGCSVELDLSVFTCDSLGLETEYAINGETPVTGATAAQADEGDQIVLSINLDGKAFSVSGPNGNDKPMSTDDLTIAAATAADAGTYTFTTEEGCSVELDLSVFTCDSLGLETEYAINGETPVTGATAAQADEGDQIVLSINLDGKAFSVSGPNGNDKPMSTDDLTIATATAADAGTYTFTTEEGCSVELDLSVFTCDSLGLETEYAINGETPVTGATAAQADEGDQIVLSINLDGKAFSVSGPNGNNKPMSTDDLTIATATAADAGTYTFTTEEGCSVELDLSVFTCDSLGLETEYAINGETPVTGATAAQADEGDQIVLSINLDGKAFSVSGPNGNDKPMSTDDLTIAAATAADAGTYTFTTEEGCSVELDLSVFTCDSLGLETEYAINGETPVTGATAAQPDEGDQIVLSINLDGKAFSVSGPNGNDKPMSTDDLTIATATAADAGTYTFTTEEGCSVELALTVGSEIPNEAPTAVIEASTLTGDAPLEVTFDASTSTDDKNIVSYVWDFGNGTTSTETEASTIYEIAGIYTVTLTVTDEEGLENTASVEIEAIDNTVSSEDTSLIISPNPATEFANVLFNNAGDYLVETIEVFESDGKLVGSYDPANIYTSDNIYQIPIYGIRDGLYLVIFSYTNGDQMITKMLVKN